MQHQAQVVHPAHRHHRQGRAVPHAAEHLDQGVGAALVQRGGLSGLRVVGGAGVGQVAQHLVDDGDVGRVGADLQHADRVVLGPGLHPAGGQRAGAAGRGRGGVGGHHRPLHPRPPGPRRRTVPHRRLEGGHELGGDGGGGGVVQHAGGLGQHPHPPDIQPRLPQRGQRARHHRGQPLGQPQQVTGARQADAQRAGDLIAREVTHELAPVNGPQRLARHAGLALTQHPGRPPEPVGLAGQQPPLHAPTPHRRGGLRGLDALARQGREGCAGGWLHTDEPTQNHRQP